MPKLKDPGVKKCIVNGGHSYKSEDNELYTGVTTILNVRQKEFLKWWTVKMMYEYLHPKLEEVQGITKREWNDLLMEGKKAHTVRSDKAKEIGGAVHDYLEAYIKEKLGEKATLPKEKVELLKCEEAQNSIKAFKDWEKANEVEWIKSELVVASHKHKFAGTLDFIAKVNGKITLGDFKTSSVISEETNLQTAAYQICLEEMGFDEVEQRLVIRIPKDGNDVEVKIIGTDLEFDKKAFVSLREVYRWNLYVK